MRHGYVVNNAWPCLANRNDHCLTHGRVLVMHSNTHPWSNQTRSCESLFSCNVAPHHYHKYTLENLLYHFSHLISFYFCILALFLSCRYNCRERIARWIYVLIPFYCFRVVVVMKVLFWNLLLPNPS